MKIKNLTLKTNTLLNINVKPHRIMKQKQLIKSGTTRIRNYAKNSIDGITPKVKINIK